MRRVLGGSLAGLGLAIVLAAPVAAGSDSTDWRRFERSRDAVGSVSGCRESAAGRRSTCTQTSVNIFKGQRGGTDPESRFGGERVCVTRTSRTEDPRARRIRARVAC
jgi:hypothetical protein